MNVELPDTRAYAALFAVASRKDGRAVETIGSIIVKAGFLLVSSSGTDSHLMQSDPVAPALVLADQGSAGSEGFDVEREADTAAFKPKADIVVEGFLAGLNATGAEVRVNGITWLSRTEPSPLLSGFYLADRNRNLFGYQPRTLAPRLAEAGTFVPGTVPGLGQLSGYSNGFQNFHRRGGGFTASAAIASTLTSGQRITVRKAGADAFSVTLALPTLTALYRTWCGHGPDKPPYWTRIRLGAMRADTLIVRPDSVHPDVGRAEVIWRAVWPWNNEPADRYRAVRVVEETP